MVNVEGLSICFSWFFFDLSEIGPYVWLTAPNFCEGGGWEGGEGGGGWVCDCIFSHSGTCQVSEEEEERTTSYKVSEENG